MRPTRPANCLDQDRTAGTGQHDHITGIDVASKDHAPPQDARPPQRLGDEAAFGVAIGIAVARMLPGEPVLQLGVLTAQPAVGAQQIPEGQQRHRMRMPILDHMQVMCPGLRRRPEEPQPVVTARVSGPEQPTRIGQDRDRSLRIDQRAHRGKHVNDRLGTQPWDRGRADVAAPSAATRAGRRSSIWDCRCRQPRAVYPRASGGPPSNARAGNRGSPLDLAPGGVYRAAAVTCDAGGLLHRRFTLTPALARGRSVFCGTIPRVTPGRRYRPPCPVEPGPSSPDLRPARPPGRLTHAQDTPRATPPA